MVYCSINRFKNKINKLIIIYFPQNFNFKLIFIFSFSTYKVLMLKYDAKTNF